MRKYDEVQELLIFLRECSSDEAHLSRQAADEITRLTARVEELEKALKKAKNGLDAGVNAYAARDMHGNVVPGDEQYPWVKAMQIGLDASSAAITKGEREG